VTADTCVCFHWCIYGAFMPFFTKESVAFLKGLAKNNSKAWFDENRKDYETHLKKPYNSLAEALVEQVKEEEPEYNVEPKRATYRINRDIRFSKDKTPYKTELGITVGRNLKHDVSWPAYTCRIAVSGIWIAGGLYNPDVDLRDHVRRYLAENGAALKKVERKSTKFAKTFGELHGDAHKRAPAELKEAARTEARVLNKQWVFWAQFDDRKLFTDPKLDQFILDQWAIARPAQEFLKDAVRAFA